MEYRKKLYLDGGDIKYYIEKLKGEKWVFCLGGISSDEAEYLLKNPSEIEKQLKVFRITGYCVLIFIVCIVISQII